MANHFGESPSGRFIDLVLSGDIELASDLLRDHPEILSDRDATGEFVLQYLAHENGIAGVRLLLEAGADPNGVPEPEEHSPLHAAAFVGDTEICELLLAAGADVHAVGWIGEETALHAAARNSDPTIVTLLLDHGADVDALDSDDSTVLHQACQSGHLDTARVLLERGADPASVDSMERPPLHRLMVDLPAFVELFERHGFRFAERDYWGQTVLDSAAWFGLPRVTEALLARGLDPRAAGESGWTAIDSLRLSWNDEWRDEREPGLRAVFALFGVEPPEPEIDEHEPRGA